MRIFKSASLAILAALATASTCNASPYDKDFDDPRFIAKFMGNSNFRTIEFNTANPGQGTEKPIASLPDKPAFLSSQIAAAYSDPTNLKDACSRIYASTHQQMVQKIGLGIRVTPEDGDVCNLTPTGELQAFFADGVLALKYITRGNVVKWHQTTPDGFPRGLDPQFKATFDVEMVLQLNVPTQLSIPPNGQPGPVTIRFAKVRAHNANVGAENVAGDIVSFVDTVITAFGGAGIYGPAETAMNQKVSDISDQVGSGFRLMNLGLILAVAQGYDRPQVTLDPNDVMSGMRGTMFARLHKSINPIPGGLGKVSGVIYWPKTQGEVRNAPCSDFSIRAQAQAGFRDNGQLFPPFSDAGQMGQVLFEDKGDLDVCHYEVDGLPLGVPLNLIVSAKNPWTWMNAQGRSAGWGSILGMVDGFSNPITLQETIRIGHLSKKDFSGPQGGVIARPPSLNPFGKFALGNRTAENVNFTLRFTPPPR